MTRVAKSQAKRKVSITLDADLVAEMEAAGEPLSTQVNQALRAEVERRARERRLDDFLTQLEAEHGPVDEKLLARWTELLS